MRLYRWWMVAVLLLGCTRRTQPVAPADAPATVLEMARARPVPPFLRARVNLKLVSETMDLAGSTGGGLVVARPGRVRTDVFGPTGGRLVGMTSDGQGVAVTLTKERRHLVAADAELVVAEVTGGAASLDDVVAVLVGDLPFDEAEVLSLERTDEGVGARLAGPADTAVDVLIDPELGTPQRVEVRHAEGGLLLSASYERFLRVEGHLVPAALEVDVPSLDLDLTLRYRDWAVLGQPPDVFSIEAPPGFESEPLEDALQGLLPPAGDAG